MKAVNKKSGFLRCVVVVAALVYAVGVPVLQASDPCSLPGSYWACAYCGCHVDHEGGGTCDHDHSAVCSGGGASWACDWHSNNDCGSWIFIN